MSNRLIALAGAGLALALAPSASARPATFPDDHSFIVNAARSNLAEIATSRLALRESDTRSVRTYARRMIADHTKANAELTRIARAWDTTVPRRPSPQQRREAARLEALAGDAFDRAYLRRQVVNHRKALALMLLEASDGRVADLRAFAARTAPVVRMHLAMAKETRAAAG
jgi:putative membrane protein